MTRCGHQPGPKIGEQSPALWYSSDEHWRHCVVKRRKFITLLCIAAGSPIVGPFATRAADRVARVGILAPFAEGDPASQDFYPALEQRLAERGWKSGRSIRLDYRWGINSAEKTQTAIAELLALAPDVVLASTSRTVATLLQATRTVPIVFTTICEPVGQGFVQSLAHPGGNATGFTMMEATIGAKWLELLKELAPGIARVAYMCDPSNQGPMQAYPAVEAAARDHAVTAALASVRAADEIEAAIATLVSEPGGGLIVPPDGFLLNHRTLIIQLAARGRLPAIYGASLFATEGGLASYGIKVGDQFRQAPEYIDRILRGEKPADLPVQQLTKYDLIINLKAAKAFGLDVPPSILVTADEVIE
jgi:putative tryptophan/tyrosine transport system substrate-binding protein